MDGADKKRAPTVISVIIPVLIKLVMILKSVVTTTLMTQNPKQSPYKTLTAIIILASRALF